MEHGTIIKVAEGKFPFHFWIGKAQAADGDGKEMIVEGIASTPNVDHDKERMHPEALKAMANIINTKGVPLRVEHSQNENAVIGEVNKAWIDDRNQLWIKAVLDEKHPAAGILYKGLKEGVKMGLSVGGYVTRATQEMVEGIGKMVNTFYDVALDEVSVTQKPSNYDARLMAKSFAKSEGGVAALTEAFEGSEFLFFNAMSSSNYLQAFSKSIPESEWKDVSKDYKLETKEKSMEDTEKKDVSKASEKEEDKTEKSVGRSEFNELSKQVSEGFNALTAAIGKMAKAISSDAKDQHQPDEKKEDPEAGKPVDKASDGGPKDQHQPDEKKEDPEAGKNVDKAKDDGTDENGEREKARKAKEDKESTYDLETVQRSVKRIQDVVKAMDTEEEDKKEKSSDKKDEEKTEKSREVSSIDEFVVEVATAIERMEKAMKGNGMQTEHIAKTVINQIRSNPEFRKDIGHFMAEPGQKRSVINGTPFVKMKDGRTFALTLENVERTEKSDKEAAPTSFKGMWGARFSSTPKSE